MNKLFGGPRRETDKPPRVESSSIKPTSPSPSPKLRKQAPLSIPGSFDTETTDSITRPNPRLVAATTVTSTSSARTNVSSLATQRFISTDKITNAASFDLTTAHTYARPPAHLSQSYSYSDAETYWAIRAVRSETLLAAQTRHHSEMGTLLTKAEGRKVTDIARVKRELNARHAKLEAIIIVLSISLLILALFTVYLLIRRPPRPKERPRFGWLSSPHHLTIPIFSPFTSVVETEASFLSTPSIMLIIIVSAAIAYSLLTRWLRMR